MKKVTFLDWMYLAWVTYLLIWGIYNHITTGLPFNGAFIQWVLWLGWALWCTHGSIEKIFGGTK